MAGDSAGTKVNSVIYDHQIFSHQEFGGVSRYFCEIAGRIARCAGWNARVIAPLHYNQYLAASDVPTTGWYVPLPFSKARRLYSLCDDLVSAPLLKFSRGSVLHQTYYSSAPRPRDGSLVVTVFDMIHELFAANFSPSDPVARLKKQAVAVADHVICISHRTADDLMAILGTPRAKITVTHLASSDVFELGHSSRRSAGRAERPYFLYVGKRDGYKNFRRVLDAYATSTRLAEDFDLVAFGGGAFDARERERIANLRPSAVRQVSGDDARLADYYAGAHAFIYPSEYEGFGIPPLEAMGCGCPVLCSDTSSVPEVVGEAGEYFDPTDTESIRAGLERLAYDDGRRIELIAAGRRRSAQFSWDRCAAETLVAYQHMGVERNQ
jgi:glycosyltransferase involved in cell wall biosynthesis